MDTVQKHGMKYLCVSWKYHDFYLQDFPKFTETLPFKTCPAKQMISSEFPPT
jgi:hypothetical protein